MNTTYSCQDSVFNNTLSSQMSQNRFETHAKYMTSHTDICLSIEFAATSSWYYIVGVQHQIEKSSSNNEKWDMPKWLNTEMN